MAPTTLHGLGVRIYTEEDQTFMDLIFEVDDVAIDSDTGLAAPAGMRRILRLTEGAELRPMAEYEAVAALFAEQGFPEQGILPGKMRPISWDLYVAKGYDARF